jgi:hypothetical protein
VYLAQPQDSAIARLRKVWIRIGRKVGSWRDATPIEREVPLRQLLRFHVDKRIARALLPVHESVQQAIALRYAALERDITEWSFEVLAIDDEFGVEDLVSLQCGGGTTGSHKETPSDEDRSHAPDVARVNSAMEKMVDRDADPRVDEAAAQLEQVLTATEADLHADLRAAGTPLLRVAHRQMPEVEDPKQASLKMSSERWSRWHQQVVNRVRLNHSVLALREELPHHAAGILCEARDVALNPVTVAFEAAEHWIDATTPRLERAFDTAAGENASRLIQTLEAVEREAEAELQRLFQDTIARDAQTALTDLGSARWNDLTKKVAALPNDLMVHGHRHEQMALVNPQRRPFPIDLREIATSALSPAWPSLLSEAAEPLRARITQAWMGAEKLQNVIDYNLGAAIDELKEPVNRGADAVVSRGDAGATPVSAPIETARKLATDALRRSGELVDDLRGSLDEPWLEFSRTFDATVHDDWQDLISQVKSDDLMSERWAGLRTRTMRRAERLRDRAKSLWKESLSLVRQRANALRRVGLGLIKRGRSAVGAADAAEDDESTIADALRNAGDVRRALPLVYRRLFTFGVVTEPSLLEGRGRDLVSVRRKYERWKKGGTGTLVLTAPIGGGRTSFLEALRVKVFQDCVVKVLRLEERLTTADRVVEAVSGALDLPQSVGTWKALEAELARRGAAEKPTVLVIDNLEHLMLQTADGTDLLQEMLALMLRTDHAVFWLAAMSAEAWRYFEKAASMSTATVSSLSLTKIGRKEAEDIVLGRHHRSGMTSRFTPPKDPSPLLKRKLRRARTNEREQEILQEMFFDGVFRHAGGGIALTLLYWLRSVEFEDEGDVVAVRPVQSMNFSQLEKLDLPRLFSLKAFVLHNTLTAGELARILRVPIEPCALILEALFTLALIERAQVDGIAANEPVDYAAERFRLSRLVVHPVIERLRRVRILY